MLIESNSLVLAKMTTRFNSHLEPNIWISTGSIRCNQSLFDGVFAGTHVKPGARDEDSSEGSENKGSAEEVESREMIDEDEKEDSEYGVMLQK